MENKKNHTAVIFIGTSKYADFFDAWFNGVDKLLFPDQQKTVIAFSDRINEPIFDRSGSQCSSNIVGVEIKHVGWPYVTLSRFAYIKNALDQLAETDYPAFDNLLFLDADLIVESKITFDEVFSSDPEKPLTGVHHPGHLEGIVTGTNWESFIVNGISNANIRNITGFEDYDPSGKIYHQGCLWGGVYKEVKDMIDELSSLIRQDLENNVIADWHDESHMNCWFLRNYEKVHTIPSNFAWPDEPHWHGFLSKHFDGPRAVHLSKPLSEYPRFKGARNEVTPKMIEALKETMLERGFETLVNAENLICRRCGREQKFENLTQVCLHDWHFPQAQRRNKDTNEFEPDGYHCLCGPCKAILEDEGVFQRWVELDEKDKQ